MTTIYIRLKHRSETVYFQALFGAYSHLAWVRTEDPEKSITNIITTPDLVEETRVALAAIGQEVDFEVVGFEEESEKGDEE